LKTQGSLDEKDEKEDRQVEAIVKISRLEPNFTVLCRVAFGINFKVKD
jgi:hypothetical protein